VILDVTALAGLVLRVVEVTVVATPASLGVAALAGFVLGDKPPELLRIASTTAFHVVAFGVADVASGAGPVVLDVVALGAGLVLGDAPVLVLADPVVLNVAALAGLVRSYLKIAVFAQPTH
jgi:hypothetical protein